MHDLPSLENPVPDHARTEEDAWFERIDAAKAPTNVAPKVPLGTTLVLDDKDERFGSQTGCETAPAQSIGCPSITRSS